MKKNLLYLSVLTCFLFSCVKDEESPKDIASVEELTQIKVANGTEFSAIQFPAEVEVTFDNSSTVNVPVTFEQGTYNPIVAGNYVIEGTLTLPSGVINTQDLKAEVTVVVSPLKLKTVEEDGTLLYEYFYDDNDRLDHFHVYSNNTDYTYTYGDNNRVTQRMRTLAGNEYPEKYFYNNDGTLDRIEFYYGDNILDQTHTYTYL